VADEDLDKFVFFFIAHTVITLVMLMKSILLSLKVRLSDISKWVTINTSHRLTDGLSVVSLKISQTLHMIASQQVLKV